MQTEYVTLGIWAALIAIVFVYLWRKGHLLRMRTYVLETREELKKCSWPTRTELKGSTVVVMISILLLGLFTIGIDAFLVMLVRLMTQI